MSGLETAGDKCGTSMGVSGLETAGDRYGTSMGCLGMEVYINCIRKSPSEVQDNNPKILKKE